MTRIGIVKGGVDAEDRMTSINLEVSTLEGVMQRKVTKEGGLGKYRAWAADGPSSTALKEG